MQRSFDVQYRDFAIWFEILPGSQVCRITARSQGGPASEDVPVGELRETLRAISAAAAGGPPAALLADGDGGDGGAPGARDLRRAQRTAPDARGLGASLFDTLLRGRVRDLFFQSTAWLNRTDHGLRIELHFDDSSSALFEAPWELLFQGHGDWLGLGPRTPIVRCLDVPHPTDLEPWQPPLKILIVAANPEGLPDLAVGTERKLIQRAWRRQSAVRITLAESTEPEALREAVLAGRYDVLHFMGHAELNPSSGEGRLILAGNDQQPQRMAGEVVANLVKAWLPRLVVLNACGTARAVDGCRRGTGGGDAFYRGIASALVQAGVPAVVGMLSPLRDSAALAFSQALYRRLADGWPIDAAVAEGRHALYLAAPTRLDWTAPVVLMQTPQADLFATPRAVPAPLPPASRVAPPRLKLAPGNTPRRLFDEHFPCLHRLLVGLRVLSTPDERWWLSNQLGDLPRQVANENWRSNYVPLRAQAVAGEDLRMEAGVSESDPLHPAVQVHLRCVLGEAAGGDRASAYTAALNRRSERVSDIERLVRRSRLPLVLLGEPGSGKTTTLRQAADRLIAAERRRVYPRIVVFVRLGMFHVSDWNRTPDLGDVCQLVRRACPRAVRPIFQPLFEAGRLIVLFDGLDEMSRSRYNDHTHALSEFGHDLRLRGGRVFFSCRTADFSPELRHERLVLLPFDRSQIRRYLALWFKEGQLILAGERINLGRLALDLARDSEHLDTTNPFILFLFCAYLFRRRTWPDSRIRLLCQFLEEQYRRKEAAARAAKERPFPDRERAFRAWSRFAWLITERNLGSEMAVASLAEDCPGEDVEEMIRAGSWCGVLTENNDDDVYKIHFEHHRYQEYFAALWIRENPVAIDWLAKLESPRWQETMTNLALMGGADDGLSALEGAIWRESWHLREQFSAHDAWEKEKKKNYRLEESTRPPLPSHDEEALLADHVELGVRLLYIKAAAASSSSSETLSLWLHNALDMLVERGSPDVQVRMLHACRNLGDDLAEVCGKLRQSRVQWVRDEALELAPGASAMGMDLAVGDFLLRLPVFLRGVRAQRDRGSGVSLLVATGVGLAHLGFVLAVCWLVAQVSLEVLLLVDRDVKPHVLAGGLGHVAARWLREQAIITLGVLVLAAERARGRVWLWCLGSVPVGLGTLYATLAFSQGNYEGGWLGLAAGVESLLVLPVAGLLCAPGHFLLLAAYATTERERRFFDHFRDLVRVAWRGAGYTSTIWFYLPGVLGVLLLSKGVRSAFDLFFDRLSDWIFGLRHFLSHFWTTIEKLFGVPYVKGVSVLILPAALTGMLYAGYRLVRPEEAVGFRSWRRARALRGTLGYLTVAAALITLLIAAADQGPALGRWISRFWQSHSAVVTTFHALSLVLFSLIPLYVLRETARLLWRTLRFGRILPPQSLTAEEWTARLKKSDPRAQRQLLLATTHQSLGLDSAAFHRLFVEIAPIVRKKEPAQSTYWNRLYQLERALRQERRG